MKRLIKKQYMEMREPIIKTTPCYPSFNEKNEFTESDEKSYSKMINDHTMKLIKERENK